MSRNGSGTYTLPATSWNPAVSGGVIESTAANTTLLDIASALTQSLSKDGQTVPTGPIQLGGFKLVSVGDGAAASDAMTYGQGAKLAGGNIFTGDQTINGSLSLSGSLTVTGPIIFTSGQIIGGLSLSGSLNVSGPVIFTNSFTLTSTNAGASAEPILTLDRNSASPAANDKLAKVAFPGRDTAAGIVEYASIHTEIIDASAGSADGALAFNTIINGASVASTRFRLWGGIYADGLIEQGQGTVNSKGFFLNNQWVAAKINFAVNKNGTNQTGVTAATPILVTWSTEEYDNGAYFAGNRFTPLVAGIYHFDAAANFAANVVDQQLFQIYIYKNGAAYRVGNIIRASGTGDISCTVSCDVSMNGSTDYTEVWVFGGIGGSGDKTLDGGTTKTWFNGHFVGPN